MESYAEMKNENMAKFLVTMYSTLTKKAKEIDSFLSGIPLEDQLLACSQLIKLVNAMKSTPLPKKSANSEVSPPESDLSEAKEKYLIAAAQHETLSLLISQNFLKPSPSSKKEKLLAQLVLGSHPSFGDKWKVNLCEADMKVIESSFPQLILPSNDEITAKSNSMAEKRIQSLARNIYKSYTRVRSLKEDLRKLIKGEKKKNCADRVAELIRMQNFIRAYHALRQIFPQYLQVWPSLTDIASKLSLATIQSAVGINWPPQISGQPMVDESYSTSIEDSKPSRIDIAQKYYQSMRIKEQFVQLEKDASNLLDCRTTDYSFLKDFVQKIEVDDLHDSFCPQEVVCQGHTYCLKSCFKVFQEYEALWARTSFEKLNINQEKLRDCILVDLNSQKERSLSRLLEDRKILSKKFKLPTLSPVVSLNASTNEDVLQNEVVDGDDDDSFEPLPTLHEEDFDEELTEDEEDAAFRQKLVDEADDEVCGDDEEDLA